MAELIALRGNGPVVLLCPRVIERLAGSFARRLEGRLLEAPSDVDVLERALVRMTLLHEIGHHVFPVSNGGRFEYLSEGLAHLFTAAFLSPAERLWLYAKSELQPVAYSTWRLLWNGLHATRRSPASARALRRGSTASSRRETYSCSGARFQVAGRRPVRPGAALASRTTTTGSSPRPACWGRNWGTRTGRWTRTSASSSGTSCEVPPESPGPPALRCSI